MEVLTSVLPITVMVLILHFTLTPMEGPMIWRFLLGAGLIMIGLTLFLIGVDIGVTPLGDYTGTALAKSNKLWIVLIAGAVLGFFISIAEPGLLVLANQVDFVTSGQISSMSILMIVSIGLALMLALGFLRIFYNYPLYKMLMVLYVLIFGLSIFTSREFLAISFDASGATTGILAVPFILSLSLGISKMKKDSKASEKDSFGLVAIASTGAILGVMLLDLFTKNTSFNADIESVVTVSDSILKPFIALIPDMLFESTIAMSPLVVILLVLQAAVFKLQKREFRKMVNGFIYGFIGLVIFLIGVNGGFMDVGTSIGTALALLDNKVPIVIIGFIIGLVTIIAEPAVHVLTHQIEEVTSGYVKRIAVLVPLSLGVGFAVALSVIRILVPDIQLMHYLVPGYIISLGLMFVVPKLFVGIAFDAGGVATGPMTATFILAFVQGAAHAHEGADMLVDGFGMIAMVAMAPIITLQLLGLVFQSKAKKKGAVK
ncbi:DUF1538 domain-containing protein [Proteiniclasticum sp.]|uniref:DUF1538 domain-containing protein n=1 Tax=Proteiniclasticum sp. TaxID=2053595 RepID=UPI0025D509F1|nr:DUF1538 domain-containing protein [Proteiniclasticum sp.]